MGAQVVKLLLRVRGVDVNQCADNGASPLFIACQYGYPRIAHLLIKAGAEVNSRMRANGWTPLFVASWALKVRSRGAYACVHTAL